MVRRFTIVTCALFLFLASSVAFAQSLLTDDQVAASFWPPQLSPTGLRLIDFARADLDGSGTAAYLAVVYCDGSRGVVRVIKTTAAPSLAAETASPTMGGHAGRIRLADLDGDGRPEIAASFARMGGEETWLFRYAGNVLSPYGPTSIVAGQMRTDISLVDFLDIDGDGIPEIVETERAIQDRRVLKRGADGSYVQTATKVLYANRFVRHEGEPELFTAVFPATPGQGLQLTIVNGDGTPATVPTSADFYVNGKIVFSPNDFKRKTRTLTTTITADDANELESLMDGKPGAALTVVIIAK